MTAIWQSLHHLTVEQVLFNNRSGVAKIRYDVAFRFARARSVEMNLTYIRIRCGVWFCASNAVTILWVFRLVLRIKNSYNFWVYHVWFCASNTVTIFMSVAFGFAHQIQLQFLWASRLVFAHKIQLQRYIYNIVINFNGHRISCSVSITLHLYDRS